MALSPSVTVTDTQSTTNSHQATKSHDTTVDNLLRPDQLNKMLHGFARSNFWANKRKKLSWVELMYSRVIYSILIP